MAEASIAAIILFPLALVGYVALHLLRLGMTTGELSEAARQRLAGLRILLLSAVVVVSLGVTAVGDYCLMRLFRGV
jgi:hypothetical protein